MVWKSITRKQAKSVRFSIKSMSVRILSSEWYTLCITQYDVFVPDWYISRIFESPVFNTSPNINRFLPLKNQRKTWHYHGMI